MPKNLSYWFAWQKIDKTIIQDKYDDMVLEGPYVKLFDAKIKQFTFSLNDTYLLPVFEAPDKETALNYMNFYDESEPV